ncbi:11762_t:CDS:2 [Cetraspora pellucida]|uniref:11762_t:CDS:1 n=1 Tax=Cetraspora pellucida TaxID=1433469 RepID=A0ACA9M9P1_9GLOM|nr:11762_t:CDS:2 [Cetraspora pellucida]
MNEPESNKPESNESKSNKPESNDSKRIVLCESDEDTWININSRLEAIFGCNKELKTHIEECQKNKYLRLIDVLSYSRFKNKFPVNSWVERVENTFGFAELSLFNSSFKEHEGINTYEILEGSNNDECLTESDDKQNNKNNEKIVKQTFSKKEFKPENSNDDEYLTESNENIKKNHKKIDNNISLDLGNNKRSINFDEHQFNFQDNFESIINELKIWKRVESTLEMLNVEVTYFRIRHYLILFDAYIALFKQARKDTP